ncbi:Beta-phosphoglucomutase [Methylacidimicrobium cyclopophantes]|uniref:Beta-phosphoglucomutase n=1 Tax=Methylacidimicrobium cyclopophantes TaxID=1041766 RepID=A0A5E6MB48_9BACT|nr:HAD family phosphatase [Methylacidimicrobium cyclopophantes]VVM06428.1 Beta-phosphoglucomutase [Methylacidimicrobium cyclopophantes]
MSRWAAIFDWDGVLVDSSRQHEESWRRLAREEGLPLFPGFFLETFGMKNEWIIPQILHWTEDPQEVLRLSLRKEALFRRIVGEEGVALCPGVLAWCRELALRSIPAAIASSTHRANIELVLEKLALQPFFATIVAAEEVSRGKPDPEVFLLAAARLGIPPQRSVVFEDAPAGVEAGKRAGMKVVGLTTTRPADSLQGADRIIADLSASNPSEVEGWFFP